MQAVEIHAKQEDRLPILCPKCKAELFGEPEECFSCGHDLNFSEIEDSEEEEAHDLSLAGELTESSGLNIEELPAGLTISGRYTILRREGISHKWVLYTGVDQHEAEDCWLQFSRQKNETLFLISKKMDEIREKKCFVPIVHLALEPWPCLVLKKIIAEPLAHLSGLSRQDMDRIAYETLSAFEELHGLGFSGLTVNPEAVFIDNQSSVLIRLHDAVHSETNLMLKHDLLSVSMLLFWLFSGGKKPIAEKDRVNLFPLAPRQAVWVRTALRGGYASFEAARLALTSMRGFFQLEPDLLSLLSSRVAGQINVDGIVINDFPAFKGLSSGALRASWRMNDGSVVLQGTIASMAEAGFLVGSAGKGLSFVRAWVHDEPEAWQELETADENTNSLIVSATLKRIEQDYPSACELMRSALEHAETFEEYFQICVHSVELDEDLLSEALLKANSAVEKTADLLDLAAFHRWDLNDPGKSEEFLIRACEFGVLPEDVLDVFCAHFSLFSSTEPIDKISSFVLQGLSSFEQLPLISAGLKRLGSSPFLLEIVDSMRPEKPEEYFKLAQFYAEQGDEKRERLIRDELDELIDGFRAFLSENKYPESTYVDLSMEELVQFYRDQHALKNKYDLICSRHAGLPSFPAPEVPFCLEKLDKMELELIRQTQKRNRHKKIRSVLIFIALVFTLWGLSRIFA